MDIGTSDIIIEAVIDIGQYFSMLANIIAVHVETYEHNLALGPYNSTENTMSKSKTKKRSYLYVHLKN